MKSKWFVKFLDPFTLEEREVKCTNKKAAEAVADRVVYSGADTAAICCMVGDRCVSMYMR